MEQMMIFENGSLLNLMSDINIWLKKMGNKIYVTQRLMTRRSADGDIVIAIFYKKHDPNGSPE
ncbi:MAG: hypothetical protein WC819_00430 [Parcubacteria group bacterium]|jgi:hypothetical protein